METGEKTQVPFLESFPNDNVLKIPFTSTKSNRPRNAEVEMTIRTDIIGLCQVINGVNS